LDSDYYWYKVWYKLLVLFYSFNYQQGRCLV
ncbi:uncharacterized protein METZ01_LOCUS200282, partial [marine metagenome]